MKTVSPFFPKKTTIFPPLVFSAMIVCTVYLACQNPATSSVESKDSVEFVSVQQPDFFEATDTIPAESEKWFRKGLQCVAEGDTVQARACYQKALQNGYPVSREYLMPVGL